MGGFLFDLRGDYVLAFSLSLALTGASIGSMWLIGRDQVSEERTGEKP